MKTINALSARSRLGTVLDEVSAGGIHYVIERLNKPLVAVIPFKEYTEVFKHADSSQHKEKLLQELATFRKKYGKQLAGEKGTIELLHKMRSHRTQHLINSITK